ncbi:MAG: hypothetical protein IJM30_01785, partial [Thermoguttaceae bacterium]|nr:hypothetical protein [Thermoguttaceae bacterium]
KGQLFGELGEYFDVQPDGTKTLDDFQTLRSVLDFLLDNLGGSSAPTQVATPAPQTTAPAANAPSRDELENFLINFVVEQTGYPREVVDLDANLEADLGIDSIKKGQLFGELGEYFDVQPDGTKTLDDFQTLRSVLDFLLDNLGGR